MLTRLTAPILLLALLALAGCAGVNTVCIVSVPEHAAITVDGKAVGRSPVVVPQKWWNFGLSGQTLHVVAELPGRRPATLDITPAELAARSRSNNYLAGSEFDQIGHTFTFTITLEPEP